MRVPFVKVVRVATPAAGADFAMPARGGEWWRVISLTFTLTTDANVADRAVILTADDGTDEFWRQGAASVQAASLTGLWAATAGLGQAQTSGGVGMLPLPKEGLWLQSGWRLRTETTLIQAGDQFSAILALVQEFHTGPDADVRAPILGRPYIQE